MSKSKRNKVQGETTEKRLQLVMKEVALQSQVIRQLAQLFKTTFSSRQQLTRCSHGHAYCKIDHVRCNYVKPALLAAKSKHSNAKKLNPWLNPVTSPKIATAEQTFIARLANKVDRLQYKYGAPNQTTQLGNFVDEFGSIWKNSNLLVKNLGDQGGGYETVVKTFKQDEHQKKHQGSTRVKFIPIQTPTVPNFRAAVENISKMKAQSWNCNPVASLSDDAVYKILSFRESYECFVEDLQGLFSICDDADKHS